MAQYYTIITNIGKAKIANAQVLDRKLDLTHIAVGDGAGNPNETQISLKNELWRGPVGTIAIDNNNPSWLVLEGVMPSDVGGFNVREVGVFDSVGDLIAIGKYPETYKPVLSEGSAKDLYLRMIIEVANTASVQLKIDPTIAIPSQEWVNKEIEKSKLTLVPKSEFNAHLADDAKHITAEERTKWNEKQDALPAENRRTIHIQSDPPSNPADGDIWIEV